MRSVSLHSLLLVLVLLSGCGDLNPSGENKVPIGQPGTTGPLVGQNAPDFTLSDTFSNNVTLSAVYPTTKGVVLYFTMWCPVCDMHLDSLRDYVMPAFPQVRFFVVDYVSGTITNAQTAVSSNGYAGVFSVLVDTNKAVYNSYVANMGSTIVIDSAGVIRMNEDYKDDRLIAALNALP
jgi:peroxiredoxin